MAFIDSSTGQIVAVLTRFGRQLLATNSSKFLITKFAFADDEIYYPDYVGISPDSNNNTILSTPILEPASENLSPLRWGLVSYPTGTVTVASISISVTTLTVKLNQSITFNVYTNHGFDSAYNVTTNNAQLATQQYVTGSRNTGLFNLMQNTSYAQIKITAVGNTTPGEYMLTVRGLNSGVIYQHEITVLI